MELDLEELRQQVIDYYGTGYAAGNLVALDYVERARRASKRELFNMAKKAKIIPEYYELVEDGDDRDDR